MKAMVIVLLLTGNVFAQDMKFIGYTQAPDCKYPSHRKKVYDKDGNYLGVIVKQDERCD